MKLFKSKHLYMRKLVIVGILAMMAVGGCKKDKDKSRKEMIQDNTWMPNKSYLNGVEIPSEPCDMDDIINFKSDGNFTIDNGPTKCDPLDAQSIIGTWALINDNTLSLTSGAHLVTYTILAVSNDAIDMQMVEQGDTYRVMYKRKP